MAKVAARKNRRTKTKRARAKLSPAPSATSTAAFVLANHQDDNRSHHILARFSKLDYEITQVISSSRLSRRRFQSARKPEISIVPEREVEEKFASIERDMKRAMIFSSAR